MDELLPIIIGIIWLAYTFYSRSQKNKKKANRPSGIQKPQRETSILEKILLGEELQKPEWIYQEEDDEEEEENFVVPEVESKPKPFLSTEISSFKNEGESALMEMEEEMLADEDLKVAIMEDIKDFDLKRAVIYSIILENPYIGYK